MCPLFGEIDLSHAILASFLKNLVRADGFADHEVSPHCAVFQMLRRVGYKAMDIAKPASGGGVMLQWSAGVG